MPTISIQATLIPVSTGFSAQPGDHLLIFNGTCIGVQVGQPDHQSTNDQPKHKPARPKTINLLQTIQANSPINTAHLLDALKIPLKSPDRAAASCKINNLAKSGYISRFPADKHLYRPRWQLTPAGHQAISQAQAQAQAKTTPAKTKTTSTKAAA